MGTAGKRLPGRSKFGGEEFIGQVFGQRTVIGFAPRKGSEARWMVRCSCGREDEVSAYSVARGRGACCVDCQRRQQAGASHPAWRGVGAVTSTAYSHFAHGAARRGIAWSVSIEHLDDLWRAQGGICPVSGRQMTMKRGNRKPSNASLDRIDSAVGYLPGNVRWVRKEVNFAKQEMSDSELLALCRDIVGQLGATKFDEVAA